MTSHAMPPEHGGELADKLELLQTILDDSNQLVQMSYLDDMSMVYANASAKAFRGGDRDGEDGYVDRHCYEYMMGLESQCPFCPLREQGTSRSAQTEVDNGNQVFAVKTVLTEWSGRPAFIEYAADVTPSRRAQRGFEEQMGTLLSSIPDAQGIMHFDLTADRCLSVNGAAVNNLKSVQADVAVDTTVGQALAFVPDETKRQELFEVFRRASLMTAYESGTVEISRETRSYFDDGSVRWARLAARLIQNPVNGHLECVLYGMDISDEVARRKALEERAHRHLALFNSLARDFRNVFLVDPDDATVRVLKLDGFVTSGLTDDGTLVHPYKATCERYIDERVHPEDRAMMRQAMSLDVVRSELAEHPEYVASYRVLDEGEVHYYQFKYLIAENDEGILAGFQNVDATIAVERERQQLLKDALAGAEEANRAKLAFLSNMSHDIRTPLNAIIGFNELAKKHAEDARATRHYLDKIAVSSEHLLALVNDVLDMSRIESGNVQVDAAPIYLPTFFDELHTIALGNAVSKNIELVFDTSSVQHKTVIGDELKLKKVLVNILSNAVKFTGEGGTVSFAAEECGRFSSEYAHFLFRIRDNGIGMSEEFAEHAFEPFTREHEGMYGFATGTGLGLSIVKNLVNIMDGTVRLESEKGQGTEFTISLHLKMSDDEEEGESSMCGAAGPVDASSMSDKRVLLVEDNELNREITYETLKEAGLRIDTAVDGAEAVQKVRDAAPGAYDIVLMDVQMPVMNGYEATRAIRGLSTPERASVPIIAVTANAFSNDRDEALAAGMDGHISKPVDVHLLMKKMRELMERGRA